MTKQRTPNGYEKGNLVGRQIVAAGAGPDDIEAVAVVDVTNLGSGATKDITLPSASTLLGRGPMVLNIDAGVATEDVNVDPTAGQTLNGVVAGFNVTTPTSYIVSATSRTDLTVIAIL